MTISDNDMVRDYISIANESDLSSLLRRADDALENRLRLGGVGPEPVDVGFPPRWNDNIAGEGFGSYIWTFARLTFVVDLCKAYLATDKEAYLLKAEAFISDWLETQHAPPLPVDAETANVYHCIHHWRMLEVGNRMAYAYPVIYSVLKTRSRNTALIERVRQSIAEHAERISMGSALLWPARDHNHFTEEMTGLLSAAAMIPEHENAERWMQQAMNELETACARQITQDGSQAEGAAMYHLDTVKHFCYDRYFAEKADKRFSRRYCTLVRKSIEFSVQLLAFGDASFAYGDARSENRASIRSALLGSLLDGDSRYITTLLRILPRKEIMQALCDEYPWGFPGVPALLARLRNMSGGAAAIATTTVQREMGQYIHRTEWSNDARCLFFMCHTPVHHGAHAHIDPLNVLFGAYGKVLLTDAGSSTYKECGERRLYKSSAFHNVPTVGGRDAFAYIRTFIYGEQRRGVITGVMEGERVRGASGMHENYAPAVLRRSVALIDGEFLLIRDTFEHAEGERMDVFFHLNSTTAEITGNGLTTQDGDVNVQICASMPCAELLTGTQDAYHRAYVSQRARFSAQAKSDRETAVFAVAGYRAGGQAPIAGLTVQNGMASLRFRGAPYRVDITGEQFRIL